MQTPFYVSGFLYNPKNHKILLMQSKSEEDQVLWSTLEGEGLKGEEAPAAFLRVIKKLLDITLKPKNIYPVYDYFNSARDKFNYVFYAEVKSVNKFKDSKNRNFTWLAFSETAKLLFAARSKQDIVVGERVINAKIRDLAAKEFPALAVG